MKFSFVSVLGLAISTSSFVINPGHKFISITSTQLYERKPFITGNWKLNPATKDEAVLLARDIVASVRPDTPGDVGLFVPFPFIEAVQNVCGDKITVGAEVSCTWRFGFALAFQDYILGMTQSKILHESSFLLATDGHP